MKRGREIENKNSQSNKFKPIDDLKSVFERKSKLEMEDDNNDKNNNNNKKSDPINRVTEETNTRETKKVIPDDRDTIVYMYACVCVYII